MLAHFIMGLTLWGIGTANEKANEREVQRNTTALEEHSTQNAESYAQIEFRKSVEHLLEDGVTYIQEDCNACTGSCFPVTLFGQLPTGKRTELAECGYGDGYGLAKALVSKHGISVDEYIGWMSSLLFSKHQMEWSGVHFGDYWYYEMNVPSWYKEHFGLTAEIMLVPLHEWYEPEDERIVRRLQAAQQKFEERYANHPEDYYILPVDLAPEDLVRKYTKDKFDAIALPYQHEKIEFRNYWRERLERDDLLFPEFYMPSAAKEMAAIRDAKKANSNTPYKKENPTIKTTPLKKK